MAIESYPSSGCHTSTDSALARVIGRRPSPEQAGPWLMFGSTGTRRDVSRQTLLDFHPDADRVRGPDRRGGYATHTESFRGAQRTTHGGAGAAISERDRSPED